MICDRKVRLLVAYSNASTHVATTQEYLESFARHSRFDVRYVHVTHDAEIAFDLDSFDIVFHSYCARLSVQGYVSADYIARLKVFRGLKLLAVQDEYDNTDQLRAAIQDIGYDLVFTCVPQNQVERVYPPEMFPRTEFITVLTGYVPEAPMLRSVQAPPLRDRPITVGYRGRDIGGRYGRLGFDKLDIGRRMRAICAARDISHDIEWVDEKRIYGEAWYSFLGSCQVVLGTESGSNVFDFDGSLAAKYEQLSKVRGGPAPYEQFRLFTDAVEAEFDMGQISPRIFEAAAMRTPMVLYRGRYSGAIEPGVHYISLEKNFSNIGEVLAQLSDIDALEAMAERAYDHLVTSGNFSYAAFVADIESAALRRAAEHNIQVPDVERKAPETDPNTYIEEAVSFRELPTVTSRHHAAFLYKQLARENAALRDAISRLTDEVARLNKVYPAEIASLIEEVTRLNKVYPAEIASLRSIIFDLNGLHAAEPESLTEISSFSKRSVAHKPEEVHICKPFLLCSALSRLLRIVAAVPRARRFDSKP